jgi:CubicO group peptidase (beta-lactamase class C family)
MRRTFAPTRLAAAALTAAIAALSLTASAQATPAVPRAQFDPAETGWVSLRDQTSSAYATRFAELKKTMMLIDLDVDVIDGAYRVGSVWRPNTDGRGWASLRNLTGAEFHAKWLSYRAQGYRLIDQEAYVVDGRDRFAGVWMQNREGLGWASHRGLTSAEMHARYLEYRSEYLPVDVDAYRTSSGAVRYAAAWVRNTENLDWRLIRDRTSAQYGAKFDEYAGDNLRSLVFDSVRTAAGQRYAGIFVENRSARRWYAYRDLSSTGFRNHWNRLSDMGYRLDGFAKYATASGARYSGVWRQNSDRPDWPLRGQVDAEVQKELDATDVPGISVVATKDGKVVYRRGFGFQDKADGVWMHGGSVHRIASISKAVAGVLALRMAAKHPGLNLKSPVRTYLPWLPAHHTYTVEQTVMNRSCLKHYPAGFSSQNATHYDTSADVLNAFMNQPLDCTPGTQKYSTHGYEGAGAVIESFEDKPINEVVRDELTLPFGLTTLRPESLAGSLPERVQLYKTDNTEYGGDDTSNKTLGGGLVSSAADLVKFANGILGGTLLSAAQRTTLFTGVGGYGYGWDVGTGPGGVRLVGKAGAQPGAKSYLRVYPDDGVVVAVLTNRKGGGHDPVGLSKRIGEAMLP